MSDAGGLTLDVHLSSNRGSTLAEDVRRGFDPSRSLKELPPKHLYDERGCELFEQITELPEYYPTRTEHSILERDAAAIVAAVAPVELVELGSGSATKTRLLLDPAVPPRGELRRYVPVDIAESAVRESAEALALQYPGLEVHGVVGDFERHLDLLPPFDRPLVAFLGGTIGNLAPQKTIDFLSGVRGLLGDDGRLLLGTDLVKDRDVLEAAYNDSAGVTAAFNKNVLSVINAELGGDFDLDRFEHRAFFDPEHEWIEMRLRATAPHTVQISELDLDIPFGDGEEIRTEISRKFTPASVQRTCAKTGLELEAWHTDAGERFALSVARAA